MAFNSCLVNQHKASCKECFLQNINYPKAILAFGLDLPDCVDRDSIIEIVSNCKDNCKFHRKNLEAALLLDCDCPALKEDQKGNYCELSYSAPVNWNGIIERNRSS